MDVLKEQIVFNKNGEKVKAEEITKNRIVALLFSAMWSPPCREFIPRLRELYTELKVQRKAPFEVIFISFDKTKEEMDEFFKAINGDWWALDFKNELKEEIASSFSVSMVPKLIIISPTGDIITQKGRKEVEDRGIAAFRVWLTGAGISTARVKTPDFSKEICQVNNDDTKQIEESKVET